MSYVKDVTYCAKSFTSETAKSDFYTYLNVPDLVRKCELNKEVSSCCRTVGIFHSSHGRFFLSSMSTPCLNEEEPLVQVSVLYLKTPPQSTVLPYPVQVFGLLRWKKRPVIIARILQVLPTSMALRLHNTLNSVTSIHLATVEDDTHTKS